MEPQELRRRHQEIIDSHRQVRKLFDYVVEHERNPNPLTEVAMTVQLQYCGARYGNQAALIQRAREYAQKKRRRCF
jgi:hypothetical protein|tara:strand:+ start:551 stop:778 length:228 start_codon:yes stop_codon:yes gene_type:complete